MAYIGIVPKLRLGMPAGEALLRVCTSSASPNHGKQSFPDIHSQAELGSDRPGYQSVTTSINPSFPA